MLVLSSLLPLIQQDCILLLKGLQFLVDIIMHLGLYFFKFVAGGLIDGDVLCAIAIYQRGRDFSSKFG